MKLSDKFEIKIFILYLLSSINIPLEFDAINDIVVCDGVVTYFDFADAFAELLQAELIAEEPTQPKHYITTQKGNISVHELSEKLYGGIKEKALRSALRVLAFRLNGSKTSASVVSENGGYTVSCSITNGTNTVFQCSVYTTELPYAERLRDNFDSEPEQIYKGVLALLSGDVNYIFE